METKESDLNLYFIVAYNKGIILGMLQLLGLNKSTQPGILKKLEIVSL